GLEAPEHHLARIGGRGLVLRVDRRRPQGHRRRELYDPLHPEEDRKHLEYRERQPRSGARRQDAAGGSEGVRGPEGREIGYLLPRAGRGGTARPVPKAPEGEQEGV